MKRLQTRDPRGATRRPCGETQEAGGDLQSMLGRTFLAQEPRRCLPRGQSFPRPAPAPCGGMPTQKRTHSTCSTTRGQCNMVIKGWGKTTGFHETERGWCCYMNQTRWTTGSTGAWCRTSWDSSRIPIRGEPWKPQTRDITIGTCNITERERKRDATQTSL